MDAICKYASSGCNGPKESECIGLCMPRPKAELHPIIAAALAPFAPPPRSPCPTVDVCQHVGCHGACDRRTTEEEARWVAADLAEAREKARPGYEKRLADRIQRRDADLECAMSGCWLPGKPL